MVPRRRGNRRGAMGPDSPRFRTRNFLKRTFAFVVPFALVLSMMLSYAPLASAQGTPTSSPTEEPTPLPDAPTSDATLAPSPTDAPAPSDSPSPSDSIAPAPTDTSSPTDTTSPPASDTPSPTDSPSSPAAPTETRTLLVRTVAGLSDTDIANAIAAGGGTEVSSIPELRIHVVEVVAAT